MKSQTLKIQENVSLASYTTFKIGGPARFFVEVDSEGALMEALDYAKENNLEVFVLGGGSNILVSDDGFDGLVIKLKTQNSKLKTTTQSSKILVDCWAGEYLASLVNFCKENSLTGLEWAVGIPGTVGGAVRGNAGAFGIDISSNIESVEVLDISNKKELQVTSFKFQDCHFSYRNSVFKEKKDLIILSVVLKLQRGNRAEIESKMKEIIEKRVKKQPSGASAGSYFKNPIVHNKKIIARFEKEMNLVCRDNKLPAGWLIDEVGLRGKRIGGVQVSEKHANFIVNLGMGKAADVIMLSSIIKQKVRHQLGVQLQEEVQLVGF